MGNVKLSYVSAVDEYLVQFGADGFNVITNQLNQYTGVNSEYKQPVDDLATNETLEKSIIQELKLMNYWKILKMS